MVRYEDRIQNRAADHDRPDGRSVPPSSSTTHAKKRSLFQIMDDQDQPLKPWWTHQKPCEKRSTSVVRFQPKCAIPASTMIALKFALAIMIDLTDDPYHPPLHGPTTDGEDRSTSIVIISESIDHGRIKDRAPKRWAPVVRFQCKGEWLTWTAHTKWRQRSWLIVFEIDINGIINSY